MPYFFILAQDLTDRPISFDTTIGQLITWAVIGVVAGFAASIVVRGKSASGLTLMVIGIVGAIVGGFLFNVLGVEDTGIFGGEIVIKWIDVASAFVGAILVFVLVSYFYRDRRR